MSSWQLTVPMKRNRGNNMTVQTYNMISIVSFSLSGIALMVSIFLYFKLQIRSVINQLTGKTAEKQVEEIRKQNRTMKKHADILMRDANYQQNPTEPISEKTTVLSDELLEEGTVVLNSMINVLEDGTELLDEAKTESEYITLLDVIEIHTQEIIGENI